jgi:bacteriorhodopsin
MMLALGAIIFIIAVILFGVQYGAHVFNIYDSDTTKWGYYGGVGVLGLIGLIIAAWAYMKKPATAEKPASK